jgi:hypothetical protein
MRKGVLFLFGSGPFCWCREASIVYQSRPIEGRNILQHNPKPWTEKFCMGSEREAIFVLGSDPVHSVGALRLSIVYPVPSTKTPENASFRHKHLPMPNERIAMQKNRNQ